jgi:hypothetical protein
VSTFSTVLGLKLNDTSDPFLLSDFIANWNLLDANPGTFICTSTSRPNWSTPQTGRLIFMTDIKQLSYWTGSAWADLRDAVPVFAGGSFINTAMNPGSSPSFNIVTFTTPRPCALAIMLSGTYNCSNNSNQDLHQSIGFDGVKQEMGSYREQIRFSGNSSDSSNTAGTACDSMAVIPAVTAGQHTISIIVDMSSAYNTAVTLVGAKTMGFIALYSGGNTL